MYSEVPMTKDGSRRLKSVQKKDGTYYYPGRKQREDGTWYKPERSNKPREYGPRLVEKVPPYDIVRDVRNARANITFGQLVNENSKEEVEVIDSSEEDLILGNDIWKKLNVSIDFENKEMRIERHEETIVIPINYEKSPEEFEDPESSSDEEEYESDNKRTKHKVYQTFK
ncbi:hypothetical protein RhiirA5_404481 [Rhizophagus irregularis]|uniref:Uncharacterized protein n=1 Tax=Rhizophagus irregularis TaxID=588596 RepID=A0A2N0NNV8_9GLOM|nr:hypothetical protein RhiirA5_404481 [Rhizophagus irregularis]